MLTRRRAFAATRASVATLTGRIRGRVRYSQARNTPFQGLAADGATPAGRRRHRSIYVGGDDKAELLWLVRAWLDEQRSRTRYVREVAAWDENPEERLSREEIGGILDSAVESLEAPYRSVFVLRDIEGLDTEETAKVLGLTVNATKIRLHRARQALRAMLAPHFMRASA